MKQIVKWLNCHSRESGNPGFIISDWIPGRAGNDRKMKQFNNSTIQQFGGSNGYTLIELMVAIGVFSVVVAITSSMLITSLKGQDKSFTSQNVADSARYAMEMISREIRMGTGFPSLDGVSNSIQFASAMPHRDGKTVKFELVSGQIMFDDDISDAVAPTPITSSNTIVSTLSFRLDGTASHPRVTIVMRIESSGTKEDVKTSMDLQTTISPRRL